MTSGNEQTATDGVDQTAAGNDFYYIRYWNGVWSFSANRVEWTEFNSNDQVVAYYLQKTDVTKEVVTLTKDWGYDTSTTTPNTSGGEGQVALTVAVVYPDGSVSPTEANMYANSTTIFNYWNNRDIGIIAPKNNSDYNIAKITVTDGTRKSNTDANVWYTSDTITWDEKTLDDGTKWYNETEVWNKSSGTTPMVNGKNSNITWSAKNTGKLVLIYLEVIQKETNLNVVYWDDDKGAKINTDDKQIAMSYTTGEAEPTYFNSLRNGTDTVPTEDGVFTLNDIAYVTNSNNVNQTFNKTLSTVPNVPAIYKTGLYNYVKAEITDNGKTLVLHYNLDSTKLTKSYVIDFGLPIQIPATDFIENVKDIEKVEVVNTPNYGTVTIADDKTSITYTPTKPVDSTDTIRLKVTFATTKGDSNTPTFTIGIIPATNVLYEENFITNPENSGWTNAGSADSVNQTLEEAGKKQNVYGYDTQVENYNSEQSAITYSMGGAYQATLNLTDLSNTSYTFSEPLKFTFEGTGIDLISECNDKTGMLYVEVIGEKNGGAYRALVDTYFAGDSTSIIEKSSTIYQVPVVRKLDLPYDKYTVTIKGYLYNKAGAVVNGADTPALASLYSAFGETADDAVSTLVDALAIPGLTVDDIDVIYMDDNSILNPNAEITKVREENSVMAAYTLDAVENTASSATVYVDGFRVYNPLGTSGTVTYEEKNDADEVVATYMSYVSLTNNEAYNADNEGGVVYYPAYDLIKKSAVESEDYSNGLLYVEYDGSTGIASIANYKNQGPQNEIYLAPGASIAFGINNVNGAVYQVSVREVTSGGTITNLVDSNLCVNSTEMYYNFTLQSGTIDGQSYSYAVFTNDKEGVVAVSGLKLSSTVTPYMSKELANMITEKLSKDPTAAFNPSMFEVSYPNTARKNRKFYLNVRASASDVVKVTLTVKDNKGNVVEGYNSLELSPSNSKAVAEGLSKYWMYDQSVKLSAGTYTIEITAYDKDNHTAVYKVSNADGEKAQPVITVK